MKKILVFTTREGHLSIAQTAAASLKESGYKIELKHLLLEKHFKPFLPLYRYFPFFFKVPYQLSKKEPVQKTMKVFLEKMLEKKVKKEVKSKQPNLIISTNLLYNPAIAKVLDYQKIPTPFINIIANAWTIPVWEFCPKAEFNLAYDQEGVKLGLKQKITPEKLIPIGWLVRKQFYQKYNLAKIRKSLGFKKNVFTILICGGSEGMNMILKIIPALFTTKKPLQVMVSCGTNQNLYKTLLSFKKLIKKLPKTKVRRLSQVSRLLNLKLFKFTDKLPQLMAVSDIVVGKAGPNLIFESIASQKPFLAICHMPGHEDGNLDLIRKKKLGFVEENPIKAIKLLQKIITNPKMLDKFQSSILKERTYNFQAGKKLTELVKKVLK